MELAGEAKGRACVAGGTGMEWCALLRSVARAFAPLTLGRTLFDFHEIIYIVCLFTMTDFKLGTGGRKSS